jgi:hypothetical protein
MRAPGPLLALLWLAGCAALEPRTDPPRVNLAGFSSAFKQGYSEGCASAGARHPRRDESRYRTDADYRMGWNDGHAICGQRK